MANVHDVAATILRECGPMTAMKLQKLAYYAQAWHLVWDEQPLFDARIEAWANGPVIRDLYREHRGTFTVSEWPRGRPDALTPAERDSVLAILGFYGEMNAHDLSELTHRESPWRMARGSLSEGTPSDAEITLVSMHEYYDGLTSSASATTL